MLICFSFIQLYKIGTKIRLDKVTVISPPTVGDAIGFMISEPVPVDNIIGISAIIVVTVVIIAGLTLKRVPSITVFLISSMFLGGLFLNILSNVESSTTALSVAIPKRAINPTHTAVENLKSNKKRSIMPPIRDTGIPVERINKELKFLNAM